MCQQSLRVVILVLKLLSLLDCSTVHEGHQAWVHHGVSQLVATAMLCSCNMGVYEHKGALIWTPKSQDSLIIWTPKKVPLISGTPVCKHK